MILGNPQNQLITISCTERSLRLAFKHVLQQTGNLSQGFLVGSSEVIDGKDKVLCF